jgi:predicted PurR-regulated permease PerM
LERLTPTSEERVAVAAEEDVKAPTPTPFPVRVDIRSVALTGLFVLAVFYTLYVARAFLVPLMVGVLLSFLFSPLVRRLRRARIPESLSAAAILLAVVATVGGGLYGLSGPAAAWIAQAPQAISTVESRMRKVMRPLERFTRTAEHVEKMTDMGDTGTPQVELKRESLAATVFGGTQNFLGSAMMVSVLLYFLLASGDLFLTKVIRVLPRLADKKRAVQIARETEDQISAYLVTVTAVNVVFGVLVGIVVKLLGMPNPVLWGVLAGITNFIPYVGALAMSAILGLVALLHYETTAQAAVVPLVFLMLNFFEGNVITPRLIGQRLALNPVVVFTGVLFWGWIWGVVGALMAVPILAAIKIVCDHIEGLSPIGEFLGQ